MTDDQFRSLCNTYGFAPSRALRELLDAATAQAVMSEREMCAKVCEERIGGAVQSNEWWAGFKTAMSQCAAAIRARDKKEPRQA